jgi:hypothetical protein
VPERDRVSNDLENAWIAGAEMETARAATMEKPMKTDRVVGVAGVAPLFVLAAPRSFSSVVASMLGQHPQMYGLPELELFETETVAQWWRMNAQSTSPRSHGLLRAVAELVFGEQTESAIPLARGWLWRRSHFTTGFLFEILAQKVWPCVPVDKSTTYVWRVPSMQRIFRMFPNARFIHLVRHPRGQAESVLKLVKHLKEQGTPLPPHHWLLQLASGKWRVRGADTADLSAEVPDADPVWDPPISWHMLNSNVCRFLKTVPSGQQLRIRGEDLLTNPDRHLRELCVWLGIDDSTEAIQEAKHPEQSPYARIGPVGARFGNDLFFLQDPVLRPTQATPQSLDGPLSWGPYGAELRPEVKQLAREFGYE